MELVRPRRLRAFRPRTSEPSSGRHHQPPIPRTLAPPSISETSIAAGACSAPSAARRLLTGTPGTNSKVPMPLQNGSTCRVENDDYDEPARSHDYDRGAQRASALLNRNAARPVNRRIRLLPYLSRLRATWSCSRRDARSPDVAGREGCRTGRWTGQTSWRPLLQHPDPNVKEINDSYPARARSIQSCTAAATLGPVPDPVRAPLVSAELPIWSAACRNRGYPRPGSLRRGERWAFLRHYGRFRQPRSLTITPCVAGQQRRYFRDSVAELGFKQ